MRNLFNMDNGFFRAMSRVADLCILNVVFLICCIPVVTIGAAVTAMSYVTLKMKDDEEGYIVRSFFHSFRQNFKQSTLIWLLLLVASLLLIADLVILRTQTGTIYMVMRVAVLAGCFIWMAVFSWVFVLQARFYNSIRATLTNAALLALANLPRTICMIALQVGAAVLTLFNATTFWYGLLVWFLAGFALISYLNCLIIHKPIKKLMPAEEAEEDSPDGELLSGDFSEEKPEEQL